MEAEFVHIFDIKPDSSLATLYHEKALGLPDAFRFPNPKTGKIDEERFESALGLSRAERKRDAKLPRNVRVLGMHETIEARFMLLLLAVAKAQHLKLDTTKVPALRSWEMRILHLLDPNWYNGPHGASGLKPADIDLVHRWAHARINDCAFINELPQALIPKIRQSGFITIVEHAVAKFWRRVQARDTATPESVEESAHILWALHTLLGFDFFITMLTVWPALGHHYKGIRKQAQDVIDQQDKDAPVRPTDEINQLLQSIIDKATAALATSNDENSKLDSIEAISDLIDKRMPGICEKLEAAERALMGGLFSASANIISAISTLQLPGMKDKQLEQIVEASWVAYFNERLKKPVPVDYFSATIDSITQKGRTLESEFQTALRHQARASDFVKEMSQQLETADIRSKPSVLRLLDDAETTLAQTKSKVRHFEIQAQAAVLPPDFDVTSLGRGTKITLSPGEFDPSALPALRHWADQLNSAGRRKTIVKRPEVGPDWNALAQEAMAPAPSVPEPSGVAKASPESTATAPEQATTNFNANGSLSDIAADIDKQYPGTLHFTAGALRSMKESPYLDKLRFGNTLEIMAKELHALHVIRDAGQPKVQALFRGLNIDFKPKFNTIMNGEFRQNRLYKNRQADMHKHLCLGSSFEPTRCLRIHYEWDEDDQLVVIHHAGRHLETGMS